MQLIGVIENPLSGYGRGSNIWKEIETFLQMNQISYVAKITKKAGEAQGLAISIIQEHSVSKLIGTSVSLRPQMPLLIQADGEFAGATPLQISLEPASITVICYTDSFNRSRCTIKYTTNPARIHAIPVIDRSGDSPSLDICV